MKFDVKEYLINKPEIIKAYKSKGIHGVNELCVLSGIHLIAAFTFIVEYDKLNEEVKEKLKTLMDFYGYTELA